MLPYVPPIGHKCGWTRGDTARRMNETRECLNFFNIRGV
jgi:hypothetical protein